MTDFVPFGGARLSSDAPVSSPEADAPDQGNAFSQGLRQGAYDARGKLNKLAGVTMDAAGFDGRERAAASIRDQGLAQQAGAGLTQFHDIHDLSSAGRWAAGAAGGMLPMAGAAIGAGLLTRGGTLGTMAAGTAALAPMEVGGQLQRQDEDPANAGLSAGDRLRSAVPIGLGRSALQNIVPAGVTARLAGRAGEVGLGGALARGAADIPTNALASGGSELLSQYGDNQLNPNIGYDRSRALDAGIEGGAVGGLFGAAGAAGHVMHSTGSAITGAPGRAFDAVKGMIPESAKKATSGALDTAGSALDTAGDTLSSAASSTKSALGAATDTTKDAAGKAADWVKGAYKDRVADVKTWGKDFMNDPTTPDSLKAHIQDAIDNPSDKANQLWMATRKFGQDTLDSVKKADIPGQLRDLHNSFKDGTDGLLNKMAAGIETVSQATLDRVNNDPAATGKIFDDADRGTFEKAKQWGTEMLNEHLGPEKTAQLTQYMSDLGDKASQQGIALMKQGQLAIQDAGAAIGRFGDAVNAKAEANATDKAGPKKSAMYDGIRPKVAEAIGSVLGPDHPVMQSRRELAPFLDNIRTYTTQLAEGKPLDPRTFSDLTAALGDKTTSVLDAVYNAVGTPTKDEATFYSSLKQIDAIRKGKDSLLETMQKSLRPELQGVERPSQLRAEADMLSKWVQSKVTDPAGREKADFQDAQIKAALQHRYGDKSDAVYAAVEKSSKQEQNVLEAGRVKTDEDGNEIGTKSGAPDDGVSDKGVDDVTSRAAVYADNKQLYLHPDLAADGLHGSAAKQRMAKVQTDNPGADVQFRRTSELDDTDPRVKRMTREKHAELVSEALDDGMSDKAAHAWATERLDDFGAVTAESSKQETAINLGEMQNIALDTKKFSNSPARIDTHGPKTAENTDKNGKRTDGNIPIDAVKLTRFMARKLNDQFVDSDDLGPSHRDARMFKEGIAAISDRTGRSIDVPDSTVINHKGLTWGQAKELDARTAADKADDRPNEELARQRSNYKTASPAERANLSEMAKETKDREAAKKEKQKAYEFSADDRKQQTEDVSDGRTEADPFGPTHNMRGGDKPEYEIKVNSGGNSRADDVQGRRKPATSTIPERPAKPEMATGREISAGHDYGTALGNAARKMSTSTVAAQRGLGEKLYALMDRSDLTAKDSVALDAVGEMPSVVDRAAVINRLAEKYPPSPEPIGAATREGPPDPKERAAKQAAFVEAARFGSTDQLKEIGKSVDAKGLQRAVDHLSSLKDSADNNVSRTIGALNDRITSLIHSEPDAAYGLQTKRYSLEKVDPANTGPVNRKEVTDYIGKVLGPDVGVHWAQIPHAGEFDRTSTGDVIRLSIHSLNPMSTAYHESMHGLFARLSDSRQSRISGILEDAGSSKHVMDQLNELLKNEPAALKQLSDPEERAAYMYQFHAQGMLSVGPQVTTLFGHIAKFIRNVLGTWTNTEQAQRLMDHFHSGEFERTRSDPNAVMRAIGEGTGVVSKLKAMSEPFREMGNSLASAGGARLRDTGIPALNQLANAMKLKNTAEGKDTGYLPTARSERTQRMNQIADDLKSYSDGHINEALEAMQNGVKATSLQARIAAKVIGKHLEDTLSYMQKAGVNVTALGLKDGVPYFPRAWDASYISSHQKEFTAMIDKYQATGQFKGDARALMNKMMVTDGAEFHINDGAGLKKPGMQNIKERSLAFIEHADAAPFMKKNMYEILNSYVTQATRRAEWSRRFKDDGSGLAAMLDQARSEGATPDQLDMASKFVSAVDGTLGDNINPTARRLMGNMIVYQNLRLLPLAIFSSAVDAQGIMINGGTARDAFKTFGRGLKEMVKNFQQEPKSDNMTHLAEAIGTVDNAMLVHTIGASYSQGMVGNTGRALNDKFFKFNLMEQYNTSMRVGATEAAMGFLARHATTPGQHSARFLKELGLDASDVQLNADGRPKVLQTDGLTLEQSAKMKAAVNRWVDGAILRPDAVDKPLWMSDPHYALMAHLKQFVFAFHETILKKTIHEAKNGNYAPAMALASYVPVMIAADLAKGMIQGGGQQPSWKDQWGPGDYAWSGMERAGLFGVGQFGIDALGDIQKGGSGIGALSGPTVEQLTDGIRVLGGHAQFKPFALKSMPANALYAAALHGEASDPKFSD